MMDTLEVCFAKYCPLCKHKDKPGHYDPCDECMTVGARRGTRKPIFFVEDENKVEEKE